MSAFDSILTSLWQIITSLPAVIVGAAVGFLTLLNYVTAPRYTSLEPPPLSHLLPFLGHALSFVRDQRAFFEWAK
jgi:hypothetical protein